MAQRTYSYLIFFSSKLYQMSTVDCKRNRIPKTQFSCALTELNYMLQSNNSYNTVAENNKHKGDKKVLPHANSMRQPCEILNDSSISNTS